MKVASERDCLLCIATRNGDQNWHSVARGEGRDRSKQSVLLVDRGIIHANPVRRSLVGQVVNEQGESSEFLEGYATW